VTSGHQSVRPEPVEGLFDEGALLRQAQPERFRGTAALGARSQAARRA